MQTAEHALTELVYEQCLAALPAGDRARCTAIVEELLVAGFGLKDLYVRLFQRALCQVVGTPPLPVNASPGTRRPRSWPIRTSRPSSSTDC